MKNAIRYAANYARLHGGGLRGTWRTLIRIFQLVLSTGLVATLRNAAQAGEVDGYETVFIAPLGLPPSTCLSQRPGRRHAISVDIVICVHNALEDVRRCLNELCRNTQGSFQIIIVDDGSAAETASFLREFAAAHAEQPVMLVRNDKAGGYTLAANQGMRASDADFVVLLNSDTVVSPEWLDRMITCAESGERVGIVGPLSNTASWQSIPEIEREGDWAVNALPAGVSIEEFARTVASTSACLYPPMAFLNGFCLLLKRALIQEIGYFDEENFARGFGEENDYCLRARKSGWILLLADDVYVFHAQSKSYSPERRKQLYKLASNALVAKHGDPVIAEGVKQCRYDRVLEGIRVRARSVYETLAMRKKIHPDWLRKRICYVLPSDRVGGGTNVVITEARALRSFGIRVAILNLESLRMGFEANYPSIGVPVLYAQTQDKVAEIASGFDVAIATQNTTVAWLKPLDGSRKTILGYYVQDYEPMFYDRPAEIKRARDSYTLIHRMVLFTKTEWNRKEVVERTGARCHVIGPSFDIWMFRPRPRHHPAWPARPIRVCAMIRPGSPRRAPALTMDVLGECARCFGEAVEIVLFGVDEDDPKFLALPGSFPHRQVGRQRPEQLASLFNEVEIFVDFSDYQAMGLTAMEAMACGVATIVPKRGGASSYARDGENCLMVDTTNRDACVSALARLIGDDRLRASLQRQALIDMGSFSPENAAFNMLQTLLC